MEERQDLYAMVGNYSIPQADTKDCKRCHDAEFGTIIINGLCQDCRDMKILEKDLLMKVMILAQQSLSPIGYGKFEDVIDELIETRHIKAVLEYGELKLELNESPWSKNSFLRPCVGCYRNSINKYRDEYCQLKHWDNRNISEKNINGDRGHHVSGYTGFLHGKCKDRMVIKDA